MPRGQRSDSVTEDGPPLAGNNGANIFPIMGENFTLPETRDPSVVKCCVPTCCTVAEPIHLDDLADCYKIICNNDNCPEGRFMHKQCFDEWEETVLTYLRSTGRARSWSERQRLQNLWTKKGYDLAYKACGCKCGKGHIRKDLDWIAPAAGRVDDGGKKKRNRKKNRNDKPTLIISSTMTALSANAGGSGGGGCSKAITGGNGTPNSAVIIPFQRARTSSSGSAGSGGMSPPLLDSPDQLKKFFAEPRTRDRHLSGSIFSRRSDYSIFNILPRHKINSYHIKMEDDGNHGNDETRCFILSTLSANKMNRISCILCRSNMLIFDRYPLIDGTFFLSPRQHHSTAVLTQVDGRMQYLNAVCMACLEGWNTALNCKACLTQWQGSHLILGSMYTYDIFAAVPCCAYRLVCNNCNNLVVPPEKRLVFFSDYSHSMPCAHCGIVDHHFAKSLQLTYNIRSDHK